MSVCPAAYRLHRNLDGLNLVLEYVCIQLGTGKMNDGQLRRRTFSAVLPLDSHRKPYSCGLLVASHDTTE